jgi:hypothetical protein
MQAFPMATKAIPKYEYVGASFQSGVRLRDTARFCTKAGHYDVVLRWARPRGIRLLHDDRMVSYMVRHLL